MTRANGPAENDESDEPGIGVAVDEAKPKLKEPPRFAVILHNDDYTTMDFVVEVLRRFFGKTQEQAVEITMRVHNAGFGVAGIYSKDIAETKASQVNDLSRARGHPLKCSVEPA